MVSLIGITSKAKKFVAAGALALSLASGVGGCAGDSSSPDGSVNNPPTSQCLGRLPTLEETVQVVNSGVDNSINDGDKWGTQIKIQPYALIGTDSQDRRNLRSDELRISVQSESLTQVPERYLQTTALLTSWFNLTESDVRMRVEGNLSHIVSTGKDDDGLSIFLGDSLQPFDYVNNVRAPSQTIFPLANAQRRFTTSGLQQYGLQKVCDEATFYTPQEADAQDLAYRAIWGATGGTSKQLIVPYKNTNGQLVLRNFLYKTFPNETTPEHWDSDNSSVHLIADFNYVTGDFSRVPTHKAYEEAWGTNTPDFSTNGDFWPDGTLRVYVPRTNDDSSCPSSLDFVQVDTYLNSGSRVDINRLKNADYGTFWQYCQ